MDKHFVIAIDGGASTGKGTIARKIAERLNATYIDTGAMYRAFALYLYENSLDINEENAKKSIDKVNIDMTYDLNGKIRTILNGKDVSDDIRKNEISKMASDVSKIGTVRERLVEIQQNMAKNKSIVMEGRDIGTVVFPNADVKIYMVADIDERARRRKNDLLERGEEVEFEKVKADLIDRDYNDTHREISPLKKAEDAIEFDNTRYTIPETVDRVYDIIIKRIDKN